MDGGGKYRHLTGTFRRIICGAARPRRQGAPRALAAHSTRAITDILETSSVVNFYKYAARAAHYDTSASTAFCTWAPGQNRVGSAVRSVAGGAFRNRHRKKVPPRRSAGGGRSLPVLCVVESAPVTFRFGSHSRIYYGYRPKYTRKYERRRAEGGRRPRHPHEC
ncbi:hypothetical protein EVAR_7834_1 [Eumeta japonica]|uniref:Uncharacterized protein n=1 Tax=Eumeta variegata TaxID=151549 RepID=A0A4C1TUY0_EUMVA|nr:hypothetical protein EVAR_7834_1 [Eumeta japonica]